VIGRHFGSMSDQPCWSGLDVLCQISLVDPCLLKDIASLVSLLSRAERNGDRCYFHEQSDTEISMSFVDLESCALCMPLLREVVLVACHSTPLR
jgi:hypothetical protein